MGLVVSSSAFGASYWDARTTSFTLPGNVVAYNGDTRIYESTGSITTSASTVFQPGSKGLFAAGTKVSLKPGFSAFLGSEVFVMIDDNHNGISDFLEEQDADGDGYFDALEALLGTNPNVKSTGFEVDLDGDGIPDSIEDITHLGTPSQLLPAGGFVGYNNRMHTLYGAVGYYYSTTFSDGGYLYDNFISGHLPSIFNEWGFGVSFSTTYTYWYHDGWYTDTMFNTPDASSQYGVFEKSHTGGWTQLAGPLQGGSTYWIFSPLYDYLYDMPKFMQLGKLGKATVENNALSILGIGEVVGGQLKINLPEMLGIPNAAASGIDWGKPPGSGPWLVDLNGDGVSETELNPLTLEGKTSVSLGRTTVDITVNTQGTSFGLGKFKVTRSHDGQFSVDLPTNHLGLGDHTLTLSFEPEPAIYVNELSGEPSASVTMNADFNEGKMSGSYGIPDFDDPSLDVSDGSDMFKDLHRFSTSFAEDNHPPSFYNGALITLSKLIKDDEDGNPETGEIRLHAFTFDGDSKVFALGQNGDNLATHYSPSGANFQYYIFYAEGIAPGKLTLELKFSNSGKELKTQKEIVVFSRKTKAQWQSEIYDQIKLQNGLDVSIFNPLAFPPSAPFDPLYAFMANKEYIRAIYSYYEQLYLEEGDKFLWAGMAKLAGAPVYAGLSDSMYATAVGWGHSPNVIAEMRKILMFMNRDIFLDLAWMFRSYSSSGIFGVYHAIENEVGLSVEEKADLLDAWTLIHQGVVEGRFEKLVAGNKLLLLREQQVVLSDGYQVLQSIGVSEIISFLAKNPIPGGPDFIPSWLPLAANLAVFSDRWTWIDHVPNGMIQLYTAVPPSVRVAWVSQSFRSRAEGFSQLHSSLLVW